MAEPAPSEWPSDFAARCPVMLFDAPRGSSTWQKSGAVGELHVVNLGGGVLMFQLKDLLNNNVLYTHKMRKADAYVVKSDRFHTVLQDNGGYKGFAFSEKEAAKEFRGQICEVLPEPPHHYASSEFASGGSHSSDDSSRAWSGALQHRPKSASASNAASPRKGPAESPSSPSTCSPTAAKSRRPPPPPIPSRSSAPITTLKLKPPQSSSSSASSVWSSAATTKAMPASPSSSSPAEESWGHGNRAKKPRLWERLKTFFVCGEPEERELEIGLPFNVQHVGHVGWDTPSFGLGSWMDDLMKSKEAAIASNLGRAPAATSASSLSTTSQKAEGWEPPQEEPDAEKLEVEGAEMEEAERGGSSTTERDIHPAPIPPLEYQDEPSPLPSGEEKEGAKYRGAIGAFLHSLLPSTGSAKGKRKKAN